MISITNTKHLKQDLDTQLLFEKAITNGLSRQRLIDAVCVSIGFSPYLSCHKVFGEKQRRSFRKMKKT
jgi:hypothetical protein